MINTNTYTVDLDEGESTLVVRESKLILFKSTFFEEIAREVDDIKFNYLLGYIFIENYVEEKIAIIESF